MRKPINPTRSTVATSQTKMTTVELAVVHVSTHTRFGSNKLFGNEFFVVAKIPLIDASTTLAGPYRTRDEATAMFHKIASEHGFALL